MYSTQIFECFEHESRPKIKELNAYLHFISLNVKVFKENWLFSPYRFFVWAPLSLCSGLFASGFVLLLITQSEKEEEEGDEGWE